MTTQTTTFKKHWRRTLFLLICAGVVLAIGLFAFSNDAYGAIGGYIDLSTVKFYTDTESNLRVEFKVDTSFDVNYYNQYPATPYICETEDYGWWTLPFSIHATRISGSNTAFFTQTTGLPDFATCEEASETYLAGQWYDVYLFIAYGATLFDLGDTMDDHLVRDNPSCQLSDSCPWVISDTGFFELKGVDYGADTFNWEESPSVSIVSPADTAEMSSAFEMTITYGVADGYDRLMIIFEEWNASSTCPLWDTEDWDTETALGWFEYQSLPFFSPAFSTTTGTTTVDVEDLPAGVYNCNRCFFLNETTQAISGELCRTYDITILQYIPPSYIPTYYLPITEWETFYASSSERYTTSTAVFDAWAETFEPLFIWVGNTVIFFQQYFDIDVATAKGEEIGDAIATARGYLESIDDFFGGLPLSSIFLFYIITALVIIVYRLVKGILNIVVP